MSKASAKSSPPERGALSASDTWNLRRIFSSDAAWESEFAEWSAGVESFSDYRGRLGDAKTLAKFLTLRSAFDRRGERLGLYASLKSVEDLRVAKYQNMKQRLIAKYTEFGEITSFVRPELLALSRSTWKKLLADRRLALWHRRLEQLLRRKPHTLGVRQERLLAMSAPMAQTSSKAFRLLTDADMVFGDVKDENGVSRRLTHETFSLFLHSPKRSVRAEAFRRFYQAFDGHKQSLAAMLEGSVQSDRFYAKARNFSGALASSLFAEEIPPAVYDHLIDGVTAALPTLYRYYDLRRRAMKLREIRFYDTYAPILSDLSVRYSWNEAVKLISEALEPLGANYVGALRRGLTVERWADRYENIGKQSGAFSCPSYDHSPYIMINYHPDLIESVFTLAHEGGHSMHSLLSARTQPYEYYDYGIFLAEIASTFNETLLTERLLATAPSRRFRAWIINRQIDAIRATIFRQTMFSEFEREIHDSAETEPLTLDFFRRTYRKLLEKYFGPQFALDDLLELECLRIPHFYRAFYVYKYATGMSAAMALAERVLSGGRSERDDYLGMLRSGCSRPPLDILRGAGVDMERPEPVAAAMKRFERLVDELELLLAEEPPA